MRFVSLCALALLVLPLLPAAGAAREPELSAVSERGGYVTVAFSLGDLAAGQLVVATSPRRNAIGALTSGVRLQERLAGTAGTSPARWRSRHRLPAGTYFVQVSGIPTGGVTDCTPPQRGCGEDWSNVLRVAVARRP
jgi:hypothetical protein